MTPSPRVSQRTSRVRAPYGEELIGIAGTDCPQEADFVGRLAAIYEHILLVHHTSAERDVLSPVAVSR
jgi:hypothetical protein